jgi:hypothetical protein
MASSFLLFPPHDADGWLLRWLMADDSLLLSMQLFTRFITLPSCSMRSIEFAFNSKLVPCAFLPPGVLLYSFFLMFSVQMSNVHVECVKSEKDKKRDKKIQNAEKRINKLFQIQTVVY